MSVFIHIIKLIRTIAPWILISVVNAVVIELILEVVKVWIVIRINVGHIEGFVEHRHLLNPLFSVLLANLSLFIHHYFVL